MTMQSLYERAVTILKKDDGGLIQNKPKTGQWFITEEAVTHVSLIMKFINFARVEPVSTFSNLFLFHWQCCSISPAKCTCPGTTICVHLIVAKLAAGVKDIPVSKRKRNTFIMMKNDRDSNDKTGGRKKPRRKDLDPKKTSSKFVRLNIFFDT